MFERLCSHTESWFVAVLNELWEKHQLSIGKCWCAILSEGIVIWFKVLGTLLSYSTFGDDWCIQYFFFSAVDLLIVWINPFKICTTIFLFSCSDYDTWHVCLKIMNSFSNFRHDHNFLWIVSRNHWKFVFWFIRSDFESLQYPTTIRTQRHFQQWSHQSMRIITETRVFFPWNVCRVNFRLILKYDQSS
jgi:hypothetical protein